jgi:hypothetical protein
MDAMFGDAFSSQSQAATLDPDQLKSAQYPDQAASASRSDRP